MYPPILSSPNELLDFDVQVLSSDWLLVAERRWHQPGKGIHSWSAVKVRGRYVRVVLQQAGAILELGEVLVWGWERWVCSRHCYHGRCSEAGECVCSPDKMGEGCSASILTDDYFLPPTTWLNDSHKVTVIPSM